MVFNIMGLEKVTKWVSVKRKEKNLGTEPRGPLMFRDWEKRGEPAMETDKEKPEGKEENQQIWGCGGQEKEMSHGGKREMVLNTVSSKIRTEN